MRLGGGQWGKVKLGGGTPFVNMRATLHVRHFLPFVENILQKNVWCFCKQLSQVFMPFANMPPQTLL